MGTETVLLVYYQLKKMFFFQRRLRALVELPNYFFNSFHTADVFSLPLPCVFFSLFFFNMSKMRHVECFLRHSPDTQCQNQCLSFMVLDFLDSVLAVSLKPENSQHLVIWELMQYNGNQIYKNKVVLLLTLAIVLWPTGFWVLCFSSSITAWQDNVRHVTESAFNKDNCWSQRDSMRALCTAADKTMTDD